MTKFFSTLLIALGVCSATFAQTKNTVELGANIGYNAAYVQETGSLGSSPVVSGFNLGVSADYYFSDRWSIKGKLIYDQKGWGNGFLTNADGTTLENINFQLNYITIPVMANWHFGRKRNWYLNFGPYAGFLLNAKETSTNTDVKNAFNSTDFGLALGIGVKFPISDKVKLFIEDDGQGGVTNIFKSTSDGSSLQNVRSSINIGLNFSLN